MPARVRRGTVRVIRIAILTTVHTPLDVRIFYKQALSLVAAGHVVTLFAPLSPNEPDAAERCARAGIAFVPLPTLTQTTRSARPAIWRALAQRLHEGRDAFDVWHFHDPELLPLAMLWRMLFARHVCLVYDVHEDVPKDILNKTWIPAPIRRPISAIARCVEHIGMRACALVVVAADSILPRATAANRHAISVRNYPIISEAPPPSRPGGDRPLRAIFAGNLLAVRGVRELVAAANQLSGLPFELHLLGEFDDPALERALRAQATPNVHFHGVTPFDRVADYLRNSDIGMMCYLPHPGVDEYLPTKLFEYCDAGLAVVASDYPLWRDFLEQAGCGTTCDPSNPDDIARVLRAWVTQPELCAQAGLAGRRFVLERYSWNAEARTLCAAYDRLANRLSEHGSRAWGDVRRG